MIVAACLGMLIPPPVLRAATGDTGGRKPSANRTVTVDVSLSADGMLPGQAVNSEGKPVPLTPVSIRQDDREIATTRTDRNGHFTLSGLQGGTYQLVVGQASVTYRLWRAKMAPPSATQAVLIVVDGRQVLAQQLSWGWLRNPWIVAGLVAAAVAIPVAIHNSQNDSAPASP